MSPRPFHPSIPPEALARQARLESTLRTLADRGGNREPSCLQALRKAISGASTLEVESILAAIQSEDFVEEAAELLRSVRREASDSTVVDALTQRLAPLAAKARQRRSALWQLDTRRVLVRWTFVKEAPALAFDDGDLHAIFLLTCRLEGLQLALDLGKRPRPLLNLGCPLPAEVGGHAEYLDGVLRQEPAEKPSVWIDRLNQRLPDGLRIIRWDTLPVYASDVRELAVASHWQWDVPSRCKADVEAKVAAFMNAASWPWQRDPDPATGSLDLRAIIANLGWTGSTLCFSTRMGSLQASNPLKMLGAILAVEPGDIKGLVRTAVTLKPDERLGQAERFEPKLKNMYEDAVLLGGGSNIVIIDEEDDEPIRLG